MPGNAAQKYREVLFKLIQARQANGGSLPMDEEVSFVAELDSYWWQMSVEEQDQFEAESQAVNNMY